MAWPFLNAAAGHWVGEKQEGHGAYTYSNGDIYDGEWKQDKRDGHGEFKMVNGVCADPLPRMLKGASA